MPCCVLTTWWHLMNMWPWFLITSCCAMHGISGVGMWECISGVGMWEMSSEFRGWSSSLCRTDSWESTTQTTVLWSQSTGNVLHNGYWKLNENLILKFKKLDLICLALFSFSHPHSEAWPHRECAVSTWLRLQNPWLFSPLCIRSIEECCPSMLFSVCLLCPIPELFLALSDFFLMICPKYVNFLAFTDFRKFLDIPALSSTQWFVCFAVHDTRLMESSHFDICAWVCLPRHNQHDIVLTVTWIKHAWLKHPPQCSNAVSKITYRMSEAGSSDYCRFSLISALTKFCLFFVYGESNKFILI